MGKQNPPPWIIAISGTSSNCGKTALAQELLACRPLWGGIKWTGLSKHLDLARRFSPSTLEKGYGIISHEGELSRPGKDTARLLNSGAACVFWVLSESKREVIQEAFSLVQDLARHQSPQVWIIEGTRFLKGLSPHRMIYILDGRKPLSQWKAKWLERARQADILFRRSGKWDSEIMKIDLELWKGARDFPGQDERDYTEKILSLLSPQR